MTTKPIPKDPVVEDPVEFTQRAVDVLLLAAMELFDSGQFTPLRQGEFFAEVAKLGEA